jgi:hypothetical protein
LLSGEFNFTTLDRQVQTLADRWTSVVFAAETVFILGDKPVEMWSKFRACPSLRTQPYHVASSAGADVFRAFVEAIDGVGQPITNENVSDNGLLCQELGHERLSATVSEFAVQHPSPEERVCREIPEGNPQNAALAAEVADPVRPSDSPELARDCAAPGGCG